MKAVTSDFTDIQTNPTKCLNRVRQLSFKKRVWNESTNVYEWDDDWTALPESEVVSIGTLAWSLDTQQLSEFKVSNLSVRLKNTDGQWTVDGSGNYLYGAEQFWTKWQIAIGMILPSGSTEKVVLFTGLSTDIQNDADSKTVMIPLQGMEALLNNGDAEAIGNTVANEDAGVGDSSNHDFYTDQPGVGRIISVKKGANLGAATTQLEGVDYSVSQLNESTQTGKVTMTNAPDASTHIYISYLWWPQSVTIGGVVGDLLDIAGIPTDKQSVEPVVFPNDITVSETIDDQAGWETGTLDGVDTDSTPNSIEYDYSGTDTQNSSLTGWTSVRHDTNSSLSTDGSGLLISAGTPQVASRYDYRSSDKTIGDWSMDFQDDGSAPNSTCTYLWTFMANSIDSSWYTKSGEGALCDGYAVEITVYGNGQIWFMLYRMHAGTTTNKEQYLGSYNLTPYTLKTGFNVRVRRRPGGSFSVWVDGTLRITATDNTYTTSTYEGVSSVMSENSTMHLINNSNCQRPTSGAHPGRWVSATLDIGATPSAWIPITYSQTLNSGSTAIYTRSSADGTSWDSWVAVDAYGTNGSDLKQFLQVAVDIDITNGDPQVANITYGAITSTTTVTMMNFTGMTCYDAISELAQFANYEFGFYPDESFFFRPRVTSGISLMTLTGGLGHIRSISGFTLGFDRVYSSVRASYGVYTREISDDGTTAAGPKAIVSSRRLDISASDAVVFSPNYDIANGVAQQFYDWVSFPRKRFKANSALLPQIDLGDIIQVDYLSDISIKCRVIGVRYNPEEWTMELDFEEIVPV